MRHSVKCSCFVQRMVCPGVVVELVFEAFQEEPCVSHGLRSRLLSLSIGFVLEHRERDATAISPEHVCEPFALLICSALLVCLSGQLFQRFTTDSIVALSFSSETKLL